MEKTKEKAQEIFDKMYQVDDVMGNYPMCFETAKKCALIAVDEIIEVFNFTHIGYGKGIINGLRQTKIKYWNEVKRHITEIKK